jgi:PAS domain S-box-containing protein
MTHHLSLKTKVSVFVTTLIFIIGTITTLYFITFNRKSIENALISKGLAISEFISIIAAKGLVDENLDILNISSAILKDEEIIRVEVFNNLWDSVAHYSKYKIKEEIASSAIKHFESSDKPFYIRVSDMYDFYSPIRFQPTPDSPSITIGYTKLCLSILPTQKRINKSIKESLLIGSFLTIFTIIFINVFIDRIVINPISALRKRISLFKEGLLLDKDYKYSSDEIGYLTKEFELMSRTIKAKSDSLMESEKRIRNLFDRTNHALFRLDRDCNIIETNRMFDEKFGVVKKFCDLIDKEELKRCVDIASNSNMVHVEENLLDKNGNPLTVLLSLYAERDSNKDLVGFDGYIIDITEKKRLEEQLIQAQKMEAIGLLAGGIAHDFNNLLQGILGYASLLKMKISEKDTNYKAIDIIEQSALKASALTKQLLGFARGGKYVVDRINLNNAVKNVLDIINRTFDKKIEINTSLSEDLWDIEADQSQIEQVILNICINAKDAMPNGGVLSIKTYNYEYKADNYDPLKSFGAKEERYAVIGISDTGIGMPEEIQKRIFEPFFTTKEKGKGTGMGLAMVYGVIKNHNGFITVDSKINAGSTFTIYLPAVESMQVEKRKKDISDNQDIVGSTVLTNKGKVLVVDDEEIVRSVAVEFLKTMGYEVLEASNGYEAIEVFKDNKSGIGLVILDLVMPKLSGKETFNLLKQIVPDIKVIVSSGFSIDSDAKEIIDAGALGFIQKPYKASELEKILSRISS